MDGPGGRYTGLNESDRERQLLYDLTCGILKNWTYRNRVQTGAWQRWEGGGDGKMGEDGQKVQTSGYKINKLRERNGDYN